MLLAQRDTITTTVAVQPGSSYLIATASKGESAYGFLQTRVEWRDSAGRLIGSEGEDTPVTPLHYQGFSTLVTAPTGAVAATISLQPTVSATWVDEVSLRAVTPDGGAAAAPAVGR
ncbi:MAG: hypothetical protein U0232_08155 [Thermomicrobiales bacterium]